jgi:hypothetical protein
LDQPVSAINTIIQSLYVSFTFCIKYSGTFDIFFLYILSTGVEICTYDYHSLAEFPLLINCLEGLLNAGLTYVTKIRREASMIETFPIVLRKLLMSHLLLRCTAIFDGGKIVHRSEIFTVVKV